MGAVKVGVHKTKSGEMAQIRLPTRLKDVVGKYAHVWKIGENEIRIIFSESGDIEQFSVQQKADANIEERVRRLEEIVEGLLKGHNGRTDSYYTDNSNKKGPDRDSNPAPGIHSPRG